MTQGVRDLIDAIASGDSVAIEQAFNMEMAERISDRLDDMRVDVAQNMFKEQVEEVELTEEEIVDEMINEVLSKSEPASTWIKDFVDSEDPKFAGKSKEKRKQMALAAYYAKQRDESVDVNEVLDYLNEDEEVLAELSKATLGSYVKKASADNYKRGVDAANAFNSREIKKSFKLGDKADKRQSGINKATDKLAKEELSPKQKKIAAVAGDKSKLDAADFAALRAGKKVNEEAESLEEQMTRKHFQQVADVIKAHPDQEKRNELAKHHAEIFKASNPRFDHGRFYAAAGANIK